jgi:hypothetical protein
MTSSRLFQFFCLSAVAPATEMVWAQSGTPAIALHCTDICQTKKDLRRAVSNVIP